MGLLVTCCGPPTLIDVDGRRIEHPVLIAAVDGGWLAVDSSRTGIRALLQVQLETPHHQVHRPDLRMTRVTLRLGTGRAFRPDRIRWEGATCWLGIPERIECQGIYGRGEPCKRRVSPREDLCVQVLRAEFVLRQLPKPADSAALTIGESITPLRWRQQEVVRCSEER